MKKKVSISKLAIIIAFIMISRFVINSLPVHAEDITTITEGDYSDPSSPKIHTDSKWYSTYAAGAGYKGQGVLVYLLERDGGGAVAGTSPVAFHCTKNAETYNIKATPKYGGYGTVTTWKGYKPPWEAEVNPSQGGALINSGGSSNAGAVKNWLQTKVGAGTKGISMVQTIWGNSIATRFTHEEIILIIEPIIIIQYSEYINSNFEIKAEDNLSEILAEMGRLRKVLNQFTDTAVSADLNSWLSTYLDGVTDYNRLPTSAQEAARAEIYERFSEHVFTLRFYQKKGEPLAGTAADLINYFNTLSPTETGKRSAIIKVFTDGDFHVSESGYKWYRNYAQRAAFVKSDTIVCAKANMNLWPASKSPGFTHTKDSILNDRYTTGMLAMLAYTSDGDSSSQTTCDEPKQPTPHEAPDESTGNCIIIKTYRELDATGTPIIDLGTYTKNNVAPDIKIEDESLYKVVAWKTSTSLKTSINALDWHNEIPAIIGETGNTPTTITLDNNYDCLYVLLEKGNTQPPEANYTLTQSSITRHITLNNPDNPTVGATTQKSFSSITFKWTLPAHKTTCSGHTYYTTCGNTHTCGTAPKCGPNPCGDTNGDGKVTSSDKPCGGHGYGDPKHNCGNSTP